MTSKLQCLGLGADDEIETRSNAEQREPRCWLVWVSCPLPYRHWRAHRWLGTEETRRLLTDRRKRPPELLDPIPPDVASHVPSTPFALDERRFITNMRTAKRGAAGGPSGMTTEHLRLLFDSPKDLKLFFKMAESLVRAEVPDAVIQTIRMCRMTALRKSSVGVRGIVAG